MLFFCLQSLILLGFKHVFYVRSLSEKYKSELEIHHKQGSVEQITDDVSSGLSEIGIVYISAKQLSTFKHILTHKKLDFVELSTKEACLYVGPNNPLYKEDSIDFSEISKLKFIRGTEDFFSIEHHLEQVSLAAIGDEILEYDIFTNSDHLYVDMLLRTDICSIGIDFLCSKYEHYDIKLV